MTPKQIADWLRSRDGALQYEIDAADTIERQAKALEEVEAFLAANKKRMHYRGVVPFSRTKLVIEDIRAARGEKE